MKSLTNYIKIALLLLVFTACEGELVEAPELSTFSVGLQKGENVENLSNGATIINGDTLVFDLDAEGDYITLNTPFDALTFEAANMPMEVEYPFYDENLKGESGDYQLELVITNAYDGDNIERTRETFNITAQDTTSN